MDETDEHLDDAERDEVLLTLIAQHPNALVSALDGYGRMVDVPASIELRGQQVIGSGMAFDLIAISSRVTVIEVGDRARLHGVAAAPIVLVNGVQAWCHVVDVRHRHGVLVGMIVGEEPIELPAALAARRPKVRPRTGRIEKDEMGTITFADEHIGEILGFDPSDLVGQRSLGFIHPDDQSAALDAWMEMLMTPGGSTRRRIRHRRGDGTWVWIELTNTNLLEGPVGRVLTEVLDISEEMSALESLRRREQLISRLADALPSGVLHADRAGRVIYANARLRHVVGVDVAATIDEQLANVVPEDRGILADALDGVLHGGRDTDVEVRLRLPATERIHLCAIALRVLTDADDVPAGAVLCVDDVTEASEARLELERRATTDELTGCLNRAAVRGALDRILRGHAAGSPGTAVVFLDLDGFKGVNDSYGHTAGDELLRVVASRIRGVVRNGDVVGRLGGDEFIAILVAINGLEEARQVGLRLDAALSEPLAIVGGHPMVVRASIGVAWTGAAEIAAEALTGAADHAMYISKRAGLAEPVCVAVESSPVPRTRPN